MQSLMKEPHVKPLALAFELKFGISLTGTAVTAFANPRPNAAAIAPAIMVTHSVCASAFFANPRTPKTKTLGAMSEIITSEIILFLRPTLMRQEEQNQKRKVCKAKRFQFFVSGFTLLL